MPDEEFPPRQTAPQQHRRAGAAQTRPATAAAAPVGEGVARAQTAPAPATALGALAASILERQRMLASSRPNSAFNPVLLDPVDRPSSGYRSERWKPSRDASLLLQNIESASLQARISDFKEELERSFTARQRAEAEAAEDRRQGGSRRPSTMSGVSRPVSARPSEAAASVHHPGSAHQGKGGGGQTGWAAVHRQRLTLRPCNLPRPQRGQHTDPPASPPVKPVAPVNCRQGQQSPSHGPKAADREEDRWVRGAQSWLEKPLAPKCRSLSS